LRNPFVAIQDLSEELSLVDAYIDEVLRTDPETAAVDKVFDCVRGTRGKMIRPMLLLLAARFGPRYRDTRQYLCKVAALVEVVHMASLIHDDIVDDSPLRRGLPTIQRQFGKDMAVFAGDFMLSRVLRHLFEQQMTGEGIIFGQTIEEMCRGELGQKACRWDTETPVEAYLRNIHGKSVVLFATAARLGGEGSGVSEDLTSCLAALGEQVGYMFQMRDDLLDFISAEGEEGKPVHQDFADGIYTLPVLHALAQPCGPRLREIAAADSATPGYGELLREMGDLVRENGGIDFCRRQIENQAALARRQIQALPQQEARLALGMLVERLLDHAAAPAG